MVWFSYMNIQPRTIPKIKLSVFTSPTVAANALALRLQEEFRSHPVWVWGLHPEDSFHQEVLREFLKQSFENFPPFTHVWLDSSLETELPLIPRRVTFKDSAAGLAEELKEASARGQRILVITVTPFAASFLKGGPAWTLARKEDLKFMTLLFSDLPRRREQENRMAFPCILPHRDRSGTGDLGCRILQRARVLYRKSMEKGARVGVMDQVSGHDFLFMTGVEP